MGWCCEGTWCIWYGFVDIFMKVISIVRAQLQSYFAPRRVASRQIWHPGHKKRTQGNVFIGGTLLSMSFAVVSLVQTRPRMYIVLKIKITFGWLQVRCYYIQTETAERINSVILANDTYVHLTQLRMQSRSERLYLAFKRLVWRKPKTIFYCRDKVANKLLSTLPSCFNNSWLKHEYCWLKIKNLSWEFLIIRLAIYPNKG